jgi:hypothetical protein
MRCSEIQAILEAATENSFPAPVQEHLSGCEDCRELRRNLWLMDSGFRALAQEPPPDASLGFSTRVMRRLGAAVDSGGTAAEFIEQIGRRFVLAGLLVTLTLLVVFSLPSSGPLRAPAPDEPYMAQSEPAAAGEITYLSDEFNDNHEAAPVNPPQGGGQTQK